MSNEELENKIVSFQQEELLQTNKTAEMLKSVNIKINMTSQYEVQRTKSGQELTDILHETTYHISLKNISAINYPQTRQLSLKVSIKNCKELNIMLIKIGNC